MCFISTERQYFILDSKNGRLYSFKKMCQELPTAEVLLTQCLMSFQTDYSMVNEDLEHRFDVQAMTRAGEPVGEVLQISLPNGSGQ